MQIKNGKVTGITEYAIIVDNNIKIYLDYPKVYKVGEVIDCELYGIEYDQYGRVTGYMKDENL